MQHETESEQSEMAESAEYLEKLERVRGHAPFLLTVLKSYKEKTKQNSDQQTNYLNVTVEKIESMYKLLTNRDRQLPMNIIDKCEGFVALMKRRLKPSSTSGSGNSSPLNNKSAQLQLPPSAPASPPPSSDMELERREPIIIPTERCENFSPQPSQSTTTPKRPVSPPNICRTGNIDNFENRHIHEQLNPNHRIPHHRLQHQQLPLHPGPPCPHPPLPPPPSLPPLPGLPNSRPGPAPLMNVQLPPRPNHFLPQQCFNRPGFQMHPPPYFPPPPPQNIPRNYPAPQLNPQQHNSTWGPYHQQPPPRAVNLQNLVTVPINDTVHGKDFVKSPSPIVDVLKSPPLTADDIDDLLHDTGASNEIPNRPKKEPPKPALSDFEAVRQKLIKSMCSSNRQSSPKTSSPKISHTQVSGSSPMLDGSDRIANKYNPHPRKIPIESEGLPLPVPAPCAPQMSTPGPPSDPRSRPDARVDPRLSKSSFIKPNDPRLRNDPRLSNFQTPEPPVIMQKTPLSNFHMSKGCDPHSSMSPMNTPNMGGMPSRGRIPPLMSLDDDGPPRTPIYSEPNFNCMNMNSMNHMSHANKSNKMSSVHNSMNPYKWVNISSAPINSPRNSFQSPGDTKFHPMLNDQHERTQYLNSRKRKSEEYVPQTYGEHKEALRLAEEMEKRRRSSGKPQLEDEIMNMIRTNSDENKNRRMSEKQNPFFDRRRDGGRSVPDKGRRSHTISSSYDNDGWERDRNSHGRRDERDEKRKGGRDDRFPHKSPVTDKESKETIPKEKERKDEPPKKIAKNISKSGKIKRNPMRISSDEDWDKQESVEETRSTRKDNQKKFKATTERDEDIQGNRKENQKKRIDDEDSSDETRSTKKDNLKRRKSIAGDDKGKEEKKNTVKTNEAPASLNKTKTDDRGRADRRSRMKSKQQGKSIDKTKADSSDNDDDNIKLSKLVPKRTRNTTAETEEENDSPAKEVGDIAPIIEKIKSCFPSAAEAAKSQLNLEEMLRGALAPLLQKIEKAQTSTEKESSASTEKPTAKSEDESSTVKDTKKTLRTRKKKIDPEPEPEPKPEDTSASAAKSEAEEEDDGQNENDNGDDASAKGRKNRRIRSELDRLQEDTHDMFMLQGGISSTGRRRCTLGKVSYGSPEEIKTRPEAKTVKVRARLSRGAKEMSVEIEKEPSEAEKQESSPNSIGKGRGRPRKLAPTPDSSVVEEDIVKKAEVSPVQKPPAKKNRKKNIWVKTRRRRRVLKKNLVTANREENEEEEEEQAEEHENEEVEEEHMEEKEDDTTHAEVTTEIEAVDVIRDESGSSEVIIPDADEKEEDPLEVAASEMDTSAPVQDPLENAPHLPFNLMDEIIYGENENNLNVEKERTLLLLAQEQNLINGDDHQENDDTNRAGTSNNHDEVAEPEVTSTEATSESENASTQAIEPDTDPDLSKLELKEEKLSDDEFESSMECNSSSLQKDDFKSPAKKRTAQIVPHKNVIKEMHCNSSYANKCVYCSYNGRYLSNHYSHHHPQSEVLISRLPQETIDRLKKGIGIDIKSSVPKTYRGTLLIHTCPFCQMEKSFTRICWIEHLGTHTGEYTFNCSVCRRPANDKIKVQKHCQTVCPNASVVRNRKLINAQSTIKAYVCDLCNYIQLEEKNMDRHLKVQHEVESTGKKTEITLLNYPEFTSLHRQRSKSDKKSDTIVILDPKSPSPPTVDSLNKEQLEVFLPRGDDGLNLDKNMLQLMSEISFSSSDKAEPPPAKTIADKLKERFRNAEDEKPMPEKAPSMADRLTERFKNIKKDEEKEAKNDVVAPSSTSADCAPSNSEENNEEVPTVLASTSTLDTEEKVDDAETSGPTENETTEDEKADIDDDNDAEWEDIEEIPEPSCSSVNNKKKSNKLYYETVSRLYAKYITQPNIPKKNKKSEKIKKSQPVTSNDESSNSCSAFSTASTADSNEKREKPTESDEVAPPETPENKTETSVLNGSSTDQTTVARSETPSSGRLLKAALDAKPTAESPKPSCLSLLKAALDLEEDQSESEKLLAMRRLKTPVKRLSLKAALDLDSPAEGESLLKAALDSGSQAVSGASTQSEDGQKKIMEPSQSLPSTPTSESSVKIASDVRPKRTHLKEIITKTVGVREMKKVENIGFTEKIADMIECKCLVKDCTFVYVNDLRSVVRHFANNHPTQRWSGFCQTCDKAVEPTSQLSIAKELLHINDAHVKGLLEKYKVECKVDSNRRLQVGSSSLTLIPFSSTPNRTVMDTEPKMQICSPLKFSSLDEAVTPENTQQAKPIENTITAPVKVVDGPKPTLKVRRLSGDRLSTWEDSRASAAASPQVKVLSPQMESETQLAKTVVSTISTVSTSPAGPSQMKTLEEIPGSGTNCPLRPWLNSPTLKSKEHIQEMLSNDKLLNFFKCMGNECKFTANLSSQMLHHLKFEHQIPPVLQKGESTKHKFLECAYCDMFLMNPESLVNHITDMHSSDVYQCRFCFYRSVSEYNVQMHIKAYHPLNIPSITMCSCQFKGPRQFEKHNIYGSRCRNVRQLSCAECSATFYIIKDFEAHLRTVHFDHLKHKCTFCLDEIRTELIPGHLLKVHNIGLYECIYCLFATNNLEAIGPHVADRHPSRFPIICARLPFEAVFLRSNEDDEKLNTSTVLVNLNKATKDDKISYQVCKNEDPNELASHLFESDVLGVMQDVSTFENFAGLALKEVIEQYHRKADEDFRLLQSDTNKIVSREKQREPKVQINNQPLSQQGERRNGEDMMEVVEERAAADKNIRKYVENTGYSNTDIYRCPIEGCKESFPNAMAFYGHSMKHSRKRSRLRCSFCNNYETTDWKLYRDHVIVHSRHRYFCYYCMKTGYSFVNITQHINNAHDVQDLQMCPVIANYNNEYEDFFIIAPVDSDPDSYMYRVMCYIANKRPELKMYFMPDEVGMLPRQAIFIQELYCGIEKYKTKVRTNMLRHMSRHANEDNVQAMKQDAVNPVPCLESNERHFDKMTNLACSSFESKGGKKDSPKNLLPAFVDEPRRYVCGAPNCNYLTLNCEMLKCHLNTLHSSEKNYMCPHCKREVSRGRLCADKIVQHLKFHDTNLFACSVCRKVHYFRHVIERHIQEKHRVDTSFIIMYTRTKDLTTQSIQNVKSDNGASLSDLSLGGKQKRAIWLCSMCNCKLKTRLQMELHAKHKHSVVHQFSCRRCNTFVKNIAEHTKVRHPNLPIEAQCFYTRELEEMKTESIISPPRVETSPAYDTTPLWRRDPNKIKSIRGILFEDDSPATSAKKPKTKVEKTPPVPKAAKMASAAPLKCTIFDDNSRFCHDCDYVAVSTERLIDHIKVAHNYPLNDFIYYYGLYKFKCVQCDRDEKFSSIRKFFLHYDRYHINSETMRIPSSLKLFSLCKIYTCYLCKETGTYDELKKHYSTFHSSEESLILRDGSNFTKCGLCDFKYYSPNHIDTLKEHYLSHHPNISVQGNQDLPYISIPKEVLSYHMKEDALNIRCIRCSLDFSNQTDFDDHHNESHGLTAKSFKIIRLVKYVCPECYKQFQLHESVLRHVCREHCKISAISTEIQSVLGKCERILVVFPSGLTLRRSDLQNTEYGNVEHVKAAIADIQNFTTKTISPTQSTSTTIREPIKPDSHKLIKAKTIWVNLNGESCETITYEEFLKTHKQLQILIERINLADLPDRIRYQTENTSTDYPE